MNASKSPPHHAPALAPVYLDDKPINLKDPKPKVSAVLAASGRPTTTDVKWQFQPNAPGRPMRSEEVLDRTTDPTNPIYLTTAPRGPGAPDANWKGTEWGTDATPAGKAMEAAGFTPRIAPPFGDGAPKVIRPLGGQAPPKRNADVDGDSTGMQRDAELGGESSDDE